MNCTACHTPIEGPRVLLTFEGFSAAALNRTSVPLHPRCIRMVFPESEPLPERIPEPEPRMVYVDLAEDGWQATCRVHGGIAIKDEHDDAEQVAAMHLARLHFPETQLERELGASLRALA